ncbi:ankyrin repeat domain-containing protein [Akkermansiaceae bacterium]|nr:ankyrin repeat domain-containing protein [Akkermansiaceae bacterium]
MLGFLVAVAAAAIMVWWPDANRLTGYSAKGDIKGVRLCMRLGVDLNEPSRWGWTLGNTGETPLTAAAKHGRVDVVRYLLAHGARINQPDGFGDTAIIKACFSGDLSLVALLVKEGGDPAFKGESHTAMHLAAALGHVDIVEFLLKAGLPVDIPDKNGRPPLYAASRSGNLEGARFLVAHGAIEKLDAVSKRELIYDLRSIIGQSKRDHDEYAEKNGWPAGSDGKSEARQQILSWLEEK